MIAIEPDNARSAANHLRTRAAAALDIDRDIRSAMLLSAIDSSTELTACAEIDEELTLLARILVARADEAQGFFLPGNNWQLTSLLLGSLLDGDGAAAEMSAPLALHILMTQGAGAAVDGSNPTTTPDPFDELVFTVSDLLALAADPTTSPELASAAAFLAANPHLVETTRAWEGTGAVLPSHGRDEIPLRDIEAFLQRNEVIDQLVGPGGIVRPDDLFTDIDDTDLVAAGVDPDLFDQLALPRNGHDLLLAAIQHDTFNHSPTVARDFVETLPIHYLDGQSIAIHDIDGPSILRLYDAATVDLGTTQQDFIVRALVTASLPESRSGVRNELITSNYAEVAAWHNTLLNESTPASDPAYVGNNWFHLGTSASDSVSVVIEGDQQVFANSLFPGFDTPAAVDQDVADGNQAIYHHFMLAQANRWQGRPTGSAGLDEAFDLLDEAILTNDVVEAQHLVAESTVRFAIEEQIIVDHYLQLHGLSLLDHAGAAMISTLGANPRTAAQVMTDDGELRVQSDGEDLIDPVPIGERVPEPTQSNNYLDPDVLHERLPDDFDWTASEADDWTSLGQRIPVIEDVTILTLTEPALAAMVADQADGLLDAPR